MNEALFWELIEASWTDSPEDNEDRTDALETNDEDELLELGETISDVILAYFKVRLGALDQASITAFLRIMEEKLYHLDRSALHQYTDGDDEDFLSARAFIVFMGKEYFDKVDADPSLATADVDGEDFIYAAYDVYEEKFEEEFERSAVHNIETGSNQDGWPKEI